MEVVLDTAGGGVDTNVLPECFLKDAVSREFLVRANEHLTGSAVRFDQLEEWIVLERNTLISILKQDLIPGESSVLQLLHPLVNLNMDQLECFLTHVLKGPLSRCIAALNKVSLIFPQHVLLTILFGLALVLLVEQAAKVSWLVLEATKVNNFVVEIATVLAQEVILRVDVFCSLIKDWLQVREGLEKLRVLLEFPFDELSVAWHA